MSKENADIHGLKPHVRKVVEQFQQMFPDFDVVSGYRSPDYNKSVKGAADSRHMHADAFDFNPRPGVSPERKADAINWLRSQGAMGFGTYDKTGRSFHADWAPKGARMWGPSGSHTSLNRTPDWFQAISRDHFAGRPAPSQFNTVPPANVPSAPPIPQTPQRATGFAVSPEQYFGGDVSRLPAGLRNNNPGNLKYSGSSWQQRNYPGMIGPSKNRDEGTPQIVFASPQAGMDAATKLAGMKYGQGMTTPRSIITAQSGWTPGNVGAATNIARTMGIGLDDDLKLTDPARMQSFMQALVKQEHGPEGAARLGADLYQNAINPAARPAQTMAQAQPQRPTRAVTGETRQTGAFAPFANPNALVPRMLAAFGGEPPMIPGDPQTTGTIIPASFTPQAPQMAPQAPQAPELPPAPQMAPQAPQAAPSIPNGFLPPSFADAAGITPDDPTPLGARTGMTQVGGESDVRRNPSFSDGFFGRAPQGMPMTLAPQGDRQYIETGFDPGPGPAENPLVVRGIRPKPEQPQPSFVPMPPPRPSNDQLFAQPQPMPQRAETGMPQRPTGSTPTIFGANWHGPNSGLINHAQAPAGTPYPDVWNGPSPYPNEGNLFKLLGLM